MFLCRIEIKIKIVLLIVKFESSTELENENYKVILVKIHQLNMEQRFCEIGEWLKIDHTSGRSTGKLIKKKSMKLNDFLQTDHQD